MPSNSFLCPVNHRENVDCHEQMRVILLEKEQIICRVDQSLQHQIDIKKSLVAAVHSPSV